MSVATAAPSSISYRAVALLAALYVLAWSLLPPLLSHSLPLDVVESLSWGREWEWGYYKHPPLSPWVLELSYRAFGRAGPFLLSQLFIAATLWLVWITGCRLVSRERALLGTLLTMGVAYYTRPALEFNHNIAQMPLWAAAGYCLLVALQEGRLRHWLLLGIVAGLGLLTKYSVGLLLMALALYLLLTPARRVLAGPGPWLALAAMLLVFAPHLHWLRESGWLPMAYVKGRAAVEGAGPIAARLDALSFLATQALNHLPLALIVLAALWNTRRQRAADAPPGAWRLQARMPGYLLVLALGPCLLACALGIVLGLRLRDMWGVPMWVYSGLLVAAWLPEGWLPVLRPRLLRGLAVWLVLVSVLTGLFLAYGAQWRKRPARTDWPQTAVAQQAQALWEAHSRCPLDSVSGDYWATGLVAAQLPDRPSVFITGDDRFSPWITLERLQSNGTLWIGLGDEPPVPALLEELDTTPGMGVQQGQVQVSWPFRGAESPLTMHWRAYVPEACAKPPGPGTPQ